MAFDPDAYLASKQAAPSGFDPDAYLAARGVKVEPEVGGAESFARGVKQGLTFGFGDEITGALESAFGDKSYRQARDEARRADEAARTAHPVLYGTGEVGAGVATAFVPGLGVARGASLGASIGKAAALGGVAGLGASEATTIGGQLRDVGTGAALGAGTTAALGGLGKFIQGAPVRVAERETKQLLEGVGKATQDKALAQMGGKEGMRTIIRGEEGLAQAAKGSPQAFSAQVDAQLEKAGTELGSVYTKADAVSPGVKPDKVYGALEGLEAKYRKAGDVTRVQALRSEVAGLKELWAGAEAIPAQDVHSVVQRYGRAGFAGNFFNPTDGRQLGREMNTAVREVLAEHVDDVAKANPGLATAAELKSLNKRYSTLSALSDVAEARAKRAEGAQPTLGQRLGTMAKGAGDAASIATALASGHVSPLVLPLATRALPRAPMAGDVVLSAIQRVLASGGTQAQAVQAAMSSGLSRAAAEEAVGAFSP